MRSALFALFLAAPSTAFGQTPADIARQVWPLGPPMSDNTAPLHVASGGSFGPGDLAHQMWPNGSPACHNTATPAGERVAGMFTGRDLDRLRNGEISVPATQAPSVYLLARGDQTRR